MPRYPMTPAIKVLDESGLEYSKHLYDYKKSGAVIAAELMNVDPHVMIKTLVMQGDNYKPFIVLMHADKEVSLKELARQVGAKNVSTVNVKDAQKYTGYIVGGISPFGTRRELSVYVQDTILELPFLYINVGRRGFLAGMTPEVLRKILNPTPIDVTK
ncbi:MAG: aminoacyl-tRNA deacylase [Candidatus Bathyarchaeota archaeon]|nr:aminoacyl-tRNA deacylase [Candidatus Bathyarchaeota archaeon]